MIRKARAEESGAVRLVVLSAYDPYLAVIGRAPAPMLDDYDARIAAGQVWVLEDAGEIAGLLVLEDGPARFLLENIAVLPGRQGRGFGRLLLDFAEAEAGKCGWDTITLYTNALMVRNIAIYAARGYLEVERRRESGFERVYMEKRLLPREPPSK
jgi:ribosomal protein S18 acetylase RimI-like enzyme